MWNIFEFRTCLCCSEKKRERDHSCLHTDHVRVIVSVYKWCWTLFHIFPVFFIPVSETKAHIFWVLECKTGGVMHRLVPRQGQFTPKL